MENMLEAIQKAVQKANEIIPRKEYVLLCNSEEYDSIKEVINRTGIMVIGYQMIEKGKAYIMERNEWFIIIDEESEQ